jgi:F420-dependent oxidoreductase-like protein
MRIGVTIGEVRGTTTVGGLRDQTRAAAGLARVWAPQALGWDALSALLVVAGSETGESAGESKTGEAGSGESVAGHSQEPAGVRGKGPDLGTAVVPVAQRHPLVLAGQALSVQAATGNRLTLGIGSGIAAMTQGMFGLPTGRPARRMREYLTVLRPLLNGEQVDHHGETLTATGQVTIPGARPPRILLAALGPAMRRVAADLADGTITWMTGPRTLATFEDPVNTVAGFLVCVTHDEAGTRARIASQFAMAGKVPEYGAAFDREGVTGPGEIAIVGDEDEVARRLDRLAGIGIGELMASPFGEPDEQSRTLSFLRARNRSANKAAG